MHIALDGYAAGAAGALPAPFPWGAVALLALIFALCAASWRVLR